jgi:hypothetical protein
MDLFATLGELDEIEAGLIKKAAAEYEEKFVVVDDDVKIDFPEEVPLTIGEGADKREIGTATPVPGSPGQVSIHINDPETVGLLSDHGDHYSIEKEHG